MRKFSPRGSWLLLALWFLWLAPSATAQISPQSDDRASVHVESVLTRAQQLEAEQRWGDALSVYEEALRENPQEPTLGDRHNLAKIHYDLGRRYSDSSFLRTLTTLPDRQAVNLYSEVLIKIESHYVTAPDWAALVNRGTKDLDIALHEKAFQQPQRAGQDKCSARCLYRPTATACRKAALCAPGSKPSTR